MERDRSEGWDAVAETFMTARSRAGAALVRSWAGHALPAATTILDLGCGSGKPIAEALVGDGFAVWGIDASPSLLAAYRNTVPGMPARCEAVQDSDFFARRFIGVVAIGLVFLLSEADQRTLLARVADVLEPGGRFLFSAPRQRCEWRDSLTRRVSRSLGVEAYAAQLGDHGLIVAQYLTDEGRNHYYDVVKPV